MDLNLFLFLLAIAYFHFNELGMHGILSRFDNCDRLTDDPNQLDELTLSTTLPRISEYISEFFNNIVLKRELQAKRLAESGTRPTQLATSHIGGQVSLSC